MHHLCRLHKRSVYESYVVDRCVPDQPSDCDARLDGVCLGRFWVECPHPRDIQDAGDLNRTQAVSHYLKGGVSRA